MSQSNLLGLPFLPFVKDQINLRQQIAGNSIGLPGSVNRGYFPDTFNQLMNVRAPWIRLASSVNLLPNDQPDSFPKAAEPNSVISKLKALGIGNLDLQGSRLAKRFILQGGALSAYRGEVPSPTRKGYTVPDAGGFTGLNKAIYDPTKPDDADPFGVAYGWGGTIDGGTTPGFDNNRRGFVPMPGITSANIQYYNNGAFAKGVINIQCFNRLQMSLIETLYMHPGYTLLLEWGWSHYVDNETKEVVGFESFLTAPLSTVLNTYKKPHFEIHKQIHEEREMHSGNYDAMFGTITKFKWSLAQDLSYLCEVQISGYGDMIESLSVNRSLAGKSTIEKSGNAWTNGTDGKDPIAASQNAALNTFGQSVKPEERAEGALLLNATKTELNRLLYTYGLYSQGGGKAPSADTALKVGTSQGGGGKDGAEPNTLIYNLPLENFLDPKDDFKTKKIEVKGATMNCTNIQYELAGEETQYTIAPTPAVYMTFGFLIAIIQNNLLKYNKEGDSTIPLFAFDFNFENLNEDNNYMYYQPGQFSANPKVCIIPYENPPATKKDLAVVKKLKNSESKWLRNIGEGAVEYEQTNINNEILTDYAAKFKTDDPYIARIANIYVNINYLAQTLETTEADRDGKVSVLRYLKQVLEDINISLGSVNQFQIRNDKDNGLIRIYDDIPKRVEKELGKNIDYRRNPDPESHTRLEFLVKDGTAASFVRSLNLTSELSDDYATMMTIAAQNSGGSNSTSAEAFAFADYSKGMVDRHSKKKEDYTPEKEGEKPEPAVTSLIQYFAKNEFRQKFINVYKYGMWDNETIGALESINGGLQKLIKGTLIDKKQIPVPQLLPFNMSLGLDGIGGIKMFEKFLIDDSVLPPSYGSDNVDIIIKGVNHQIDKSSWITNLDTYMAPKNPLSSIVRPDPLRATAPSRKKPSGGTSGGDGGTGHKSRPKPGKVAKEDAKRRIRLTRLFDDGAQTCGYMEVLAEDEKTVLYRLPTSELAWKGNKNSVSCIFLDRYYVKSHTSPKHKQCFWVFQSKSSGWANNALHYNGYTRGAVLIHKAPIAPGWLEGCIAPGLKFNTSNIKDGKQVRKQLGTGTKYLNPAKGQSQQAVNKLLDTLYSVGGFFMDIRNINDVPNGQLKAQGYDRIGHPSVQKLIKLYNLA